MGGFRLADRCVEREDKERMELRLSSCYQNFLSTPSREYLSLSS